MAEKKSRWEKYGYAQRDGKGDWLYGFDPKTLRGSQLAPGTRKGPWEPMTAVHKSFGRVQVNPHGIFSSHSPSVGSALMRAHKDWNDSQQRAAGKRAGRSSGSKKTSRNARSKKASSSYAGG